MMLIDNNSRALFPLQGIENSLSSFKSACNIFYLSETNCSDFQAYFFVDLTLLSFLS